jgi:prepilin-type N-terminal cleavage/methylation domain-containing protein
MKKMNKKGFTLIELLAVIVILGLLMAIAIPSVTKYITQSRKKTLTNTMSNYMAALTTEVNNLTYTFTADNTIYAVPIECIALERG